MVLDQSRDIDETPVTPRYPLGATGEPQGSRRAPASVSLRQAGAGFDSHPYDDYDDRESNADVSFSDESYIRLLHYSHDRFPYRKQPPLLKCHRIVFQEYEETCLFTKHESLQGDSPRVCTNILKCSLHSLVTKGIRLVGFATRAMVCESPTHYLILNSLAIARGCVILRSHFLILLLLIILISPYILTYFSLLQ